ncbi:hypothetical protein M1B34_33135 [Pseudomonas sp. MAFF 302030]|uniref:Uncharacterized protein n=1 Tax=Pseudomonas morbosilactucae TaxID=2938197 RepID=A0A9X1Z241_9PSED|nr:hypothetical protein [Pseudomonas morbosilactucae]MCK9802362.1 hypothetical protein [Pseudomonas morbosilactucae]
MFWKRENKVQVELTAPITITHPNCANPQVSTPESPVTKEVDKDFALKLLISFALFIQAALFVDGYLELTAYYEQFGIQTSELDLTNPTILAAGYLHSFTGVMNWVDGIPLIGPLLPWLPFAAVALTYAYLLANRETKRQALIEKGFTGGVALLILFIAPVFGVLHGVDRGRQDISAMTAIEVANGVGKEHSVVTKNGERITGHLLAADTKSTFIFSNDTVYKIDNRTSRITRQTLLKEKPIKALRMGNE